MQEQVIKSMQKPLQLSGAFFMLVSPCLSYEYTVHVWDSCAAFYGDIR